LRLKKYEKEAIISTFKEIFENGEIILFGSRIDDTKRGGDIDLYIKAPYSFEKKIKFLAKLKRKIGDRKIDVVFNEDENRLIEKEANCGITLYTNKN
jgi:predicted nucleotidyltransferase